MRTPSILRAALPATVALTIIAMPAAAVPSQVAEVTTSANAIEWSPNAEYAGFHLVVSGPDGVVERHFDGGDRPTLSLAELEAVSDGVYKWELRAAPVLSSAAKAALSQGGGSPERGLRPSATDGTANVMSGSFRVVGGAIVQPGATEAPARLSPDRANKGAGSATAPLTRATAADQVIPDDLIVQGSLCAGLDCVNGEDFGFDTIRMKENNTRIQFNDTSSVSGFPTNNWQIRANASASGGASFLGFVDQGATGQSETGTIVLSVDAGAPASSIDVASTGRVGLRTSTPVLDLHIATGNTPGIRLEQTNAGGFTAQTWDIAGNEANFFVRDVTGGSTLPFRIRPGAPTSSIDIAADGDVGIGTASPGTLSDGSHASVHISRSDGDASLLIEETSGTNALRTLMEMKNNGAVSMRFDNTAVGSGAEWEYQATDNFFRVNRLGMAGDEFQIDADGDVTITGDYFSTTCTTPCAPDYVFEPDYQLMPLTELASFVKERKHLPNVPSAEEMARDGHNVSKLQFKLLEKVEELTLYVVAQDEMIKKLQAELSDLRDER